MKRWDYLLQILPEDAGCGAEIGVYKGQFSKKIKQARPDIRHYMIDPWKPYADRNSRGKLTNFGKGLTTTEEMLDVMKQAISVALDYDCIVIPAESLKAVEMFEDNSLDYVFIDASHEYEDVKADIEVWSPKVKKGGIVGGHNYKDKTYPGVTKAVDEFFKPTAGPDKTWWVIK